MRRSAFTPMPGCFRIRSGNSNDPEGIFMHSVLFVAAPSANRAEWAQFQMQLDPRLRQAEGVAQLAENVWLLNLVQATAPLARLLAAAQQTGVSYGLLPFEREPQWLPADFDPKTTQAQKASF